MVNQRPGHLTAFCTPPVLHPATHTTPKYTPSEGHHRCLDPGVRSGTGHASNRRVAPPPIPSGENPLLRGSAGHLSGHGSWGSKTRVWAARARGVVGDEPAPLSVPLGVVGGYRGKGWQQHTACRPMHHRPTCWGPMLACSRGYGSRWLLRNHDTHTRRQTQNQTQSQLL